MRVNCCRKSQHKLGVKYFLTPPRPSSFPSSCQENKTLPLTRAMPLTFNFAHKCLPFPFYSSAGSFLNYLLYSLSLFCLVNIDDIQGYTLCQVFSFCSLIPIICQLPWSIKTNSDLIRRDCIWKDYYKEWAKKDHRRDNHYDYSIQVSQALGQRFFLLLERANKTGKNQVWGSEMNRKEKLLKTGCRMAQAEGDPKTRGLAEGKKSYCYLVIKYLVLTDRRDKQV